MAVVICYLSLCALGRRPFFVDFSLEAATFSFRPSSFNVPPFRASLAPVRLAGGLTTDDYENGWFWYLMLSALISYISTYQRS